jgi:polar amino acid transport system substrate-binding protein
MRVIVIFFAALLGGAIALAGAHFLKPGAGESNAQKTAFSRVKDTQTLRCGYIVVSPGLMKDIKTGEMSGTAYEIINEVGKVLNLKIEWTEETTFGSAIEGLKTGRYDMLCTTLYMRPNMMPHVEFTQAYYYLPIHVVQRTGEDRFKTVSDVNRPEIKISAIDGTIPALLAAEDFPDAAKFSLSESNDYAENMMSVVTRKADVTLMDPLIFNNFDKNNPGQLEINGDIPPLRVFAKTFAVLKGEHDLNTMISYAIQHLLNNGKIEPIISKYEPFPGTLMRVSKAYKDNSSHAP